MKCAGDVLGVQVPDVGLDFVPKKSGTPDDVDLSSSGADGLPIPKPRVFLGPSGPAFPRPAKRVDGGVSAQDGAGLV